MKKRKIVNIEYITGETVTVTSENLPAWICSCEAVHPILHQSRIVDSDSHALCNFCAKQYSTKRYENGRAIIFNLAECG